MKKKFLILIFLLPLIAGCKSSILEDPATKIGFGIPQRSHVKLTIENSYNTVISVLVDQELQSGSYQADFQMDDLAEGVYYYVLEVRGIEDNSYSSTTRHFLLMK